MARAGPRPTPPDQMGNRMEPSVAWTKLGTLAATAALAFCALGTPALGLTTGVALNYIVPDTAGPSTKGWAFNVTSSQLLVGLGAFDYFGDGFYNDHEVGIWDTNGTLLASVVVGSQDALINGYRFVANTPFTLRAGSTYIVAAADLGRDPTPVAGEVVIAPGISYLGSRAYSGAGLHFPQDAATANSFGGNILLSEAVPEPATWAMMIIGFGAVGVMVRRARRRTIFSPA